MTKDDAMIKFYHSGEFSKTYQFLNRLAGKSYLNIFDKYGKMGVEALKKATPKDTGKTSESWSYDITETNQGIRIGWKNSNIAYNSRGHGFNVAVILQMGHATRNGGWVEGIDYINPALKPVFEEIAEKAFMEIVHKT